MEPLKLSTSKSLTTPHFKNHFWVPQNSRIVSVYNKKGRTFSFTLTCKLKTSKGKKKISKKNKISWPDSGGAPPLLEVAEAVTKNNNADGKVVFIKKVPKRILGVLSNLLLPFGEMFVVASLMALGSSIIEQGEVPEFVFQNFREDHPLSFGTAALHALKGLANRIASIGVHLALLLVMSGGTLDAAGSLAEDMTVPQGINSVVEDAIALSGDLSSRYDDAFSTEIHVNRFYVDYDECGEVSQFHTDISLFDLNGEEVLRKTISCGLDLKTDSEVPIVYAGFGSLMLSTCISYLSHAQLSALQDGTKEVVRGKTNRAKSESSDTVDGSLDQVPDVFESSCTEESDGFIGFRIQVGIWNKKDFDM